MPIGGTEQNGAHMVLGKHNVRAHVLADRIAQALGNAIVAPTVAYVPEGSIHPPAAHMKYTGTISVPDAVFEGLLEAAARSFKQHGFRDVVFLGDHGGYQADLDARGRQAQSRMGPGSGLPRPRAARVLPDHPDRLRRRAEGPRRLRRGDGLACRPGRYRPRRSPSIPALVRADKLAGPVPRRRDRQPPKRATAELGDLGTHAGRFETTVAAIRKETQAPR